MVNKETSSDQNRKKAFYEIAFPCVITTHRVTRFSSVFSLLTQFSGNLQYDTSKRNEAYGDKGNILRWKLGRSFVRISSVLCEFISQGYTYVSCSSPLSLFWRNLRRNSLDCIETYADKENIISSKRKRSFLRNFSVICEFLSQCYTWVLRKQFANTLFVESAKCDLGASRGPWWKRKYPQVITREKPTERLLSDVWRHHTDFHPSLLGTVC